LAWAWVDAALVSLFLSLGSRPLSSLSLSTDFIYFLAGFQFQFLSHDPVPFYALYFFLDQLFRTILCAVSSVFLGADGWWFRSFLSVDAVFQLTGYTLLYSIWHLSVSLLFFGTKKVMVPLFGRISLPG
jgi:hypothetical protein